MKIKSLVLCFSSLAQIVVIGVVAVVVVVVVDDVLQ